MTSNGTNGFTYRTFVSTSIKRIVITMFIICCILSIQHIASRIGRKPDYSPDKLTFAIFKNKRTKNTKDITVEFSFRSSALSVNNISLTDFSGEYEETPSVLPINNNKFRYTIEELYFAVTTNTKRIHNTIHYLKFWAKIPEIKCLIVFEENDFMNNRNITEYLVHQGLSCKIQTSNITRYEERYLHLFHLAWNSQEKTARKLIQWFAIGDDDTVWFINNLLYTLQQYNSSQSIYVGDISDKKTQVQRHGAYFAYGGGGILLSRPLAVLFSQHTPNCKRYTNIDAGDAMVGKCITEVLNVSLTINNNFLQMDHFGDITGYLESGIDGLVTLHHMYSVWKPFPDRPDQNINETMHLLYVAYNTFDNKFLKRYVRINRKTNQTLLLTMGYSFSLFNRILSRSDLDRVENTWEGSEMTARRTRPEEKSKNTWFFRTVSNETYNGLIRYRTTYESRQYKPDTRQYIDVIFTD